jgi:hypothetical protein
MGKLFKIVDGGSAAQTAADINDVGWAFEGYRQDGGWTVEHGEGDADDQGANLALSLTSSLSDFKIPVMPA